MKGGLIDLPFNVNLTDLRSLWSSPLEGGPGRFCGRILRVSSTSSTLVAASCLRVLGSGGFRSSTLLGASCLGGLGGGEFQYSGPIFSISHTHSSSLQALGFIVTKDCQRRKRQTFRAKREDELMNLIRSSCSL